VLFSTDGSVADLGFTVLADDRRLQNVDNLVPVIRTTARTPAVVAALNRLSAVLTTRDVVLMNKAVDIDRRSPARVAAAFLAAKGLD
jgi:osmoprotectant transport system substrate-binding protein